MQFMVAISASEDGLRVLAALQDYKKIAVPTKRSDGKKFRPVSIDFAYRTGRNGPEEIESIPDKLRRIANEDIGGNSPRIADDLKGLAFALEQDMNRDS
jgi:hypothetical protein